MRLTRTLALTLAAATLGAACGSEPLDPDGVVDLSTEYAFAYQHDECAPWDGPAVRLYFVQEAMAEPWAASFPHVTVSVYETLASLVGRDVTWEAEDLNTGYAARCPTEGTCVTATASRLRVHESGSDGRVRGDLRLDFADGTRIEGAFDAERLDVQLLCG